MPPFPKILRGHVWTIPGNILVKFESVALTVLELLALNAQTGLIDRSTAHRHTQIQTHESNEYSISAIQSVHLAEIITVFRDFTLASVLVQ